MTKAVFHNKLHFYLTLLVALTLPFVKITPVFIVLITVNWAFEGDFKNKLHLFLTNKLALLFVSLYLIHIVVFFYSQNMKAVWFDLQVKLSIFIFPVLIASKPLSSRKKTFVLAAFIAGAFIVSLYMLARATYIYFTLGENEFFYVDFSSPIHPSYFAMYLAFAIALLTIDLLFSEKHLQKISNTFSVLLISFFSLIIILLSSKSGLFTLLSIFFFNIVYVVFWLKKYWIGILSIVIALVVFVGVVKSNHLVFDRLHEFVDAVVTYKQDENRDEAKSTKIRLRVWESAVAVIKDNFWVGVGSGDAKDELMKSYKKRGLDYIYTSNLNAHNEFLQVFVGLGIIGFLYSWLIFLFHCLWHIKQLTGFICFFY